MSKRIKVAIGGAVVVVILAGGFYVSKTYYGRDVRSQRLFEEHDPWLYSANVVVATGFRNSFGEVVRLTVSTRGMGLQDEVRFGRISSIRLPEVLSGQVSGEALQQVLADVRDLPTGGGWLTADRLVLISFWDGARWRTEKYDRTNLPTQVTQIRDLLQSSLKPVVRHRGGSNDVERLRGSTEAR